MEKSLIARNTSKLNWERDMLGVKNPRIVINCERCQNVKLCRSCIKDPKLNLFDCEISRSCDKCSKKYHKSNHIQPKSTNEKNSHLTIMVIRYLTMLKKILLKKKREIKHKIVTANLINALLK